jgi:riboflavin kinase / FMN adenylyltransferase
MEIIRVKSIHEVKSSEVTVVTIGNFDGIHLGHQLLINDTIKTAKEKKCVSGVITFEPHPLLLLNPKNNLRFLSTIDRKLELIERIGIDRIYIVEFTKALSLMDFIDFFEVFFVDALKVQAIVIGENFCFGKDRKGDIVELKKLCDTKDIKLTIHKLVSEVGEVINSSLIRKYIQLGDTKKAGDLLGRYYSMNCTVVKGCGVGHDLGFPTANLDFRAMVIPADGIYAAFATIEGVKYESVVNIGLCPTFDRANRSFEVHIMDFDENLYGKKIQIEFVEKIRDEMKFDSIDNLKAQINKDITEAVEILRARK